MPDVGLRRVFSAAARIASATSAGGLCTVDNPRAEAPVCGLNIFIPSERRRQLLRMFAERICSAGSETVPQRLVVSHLASDTAGPQ